MPRMRWMWIAYHSYSNVIATTVTIVLIALLLPAETTASIEAPQLFLMGAAAVFVSIFVGAISGFRFSRNIRDRLEEISIGTRNLAFGNLQYRLPFTDDTEVGDIAQAFNEMAERLEKQVVALQKITEENEQLIQQTKLAAISQERQRLARDLHDAVSQQLFAISMMAATASKIATSKPERCAELVQNIAESASRAQSEMRALLLQLRPVTLENQRLVDALTSLAHELRNKQVIDCELSLDDVDFSANIENQLYRIAQEGLSNILRHAEATKVHISLTVSDNPKRLLLVIEDNGKGFREEDVPKSSMGMKSIRERAELLGGTVNWISIPSQGTRLEIRLPLIDPMLEPLN